MMAARVLQMPPRATVSRRELLDLELASRELQAATKEFARLRRLYDAKRHDVARRLAAGAEIREERAG